MDPGVVTFITVCGLVGGGFAVNEWSHGGMSEALGLGHHHLMDYGEYHCASHDDPDRGPQHLAHMHGNESRPHEGCPGGSSMHRGMNGPGETV